MLTDGWDDDGAVDGAFNKVGAFEVYEIEPKWIAQADP